MWMYCIALYLLILHAPGGIKMWQQAWYYVSLFICTSLSQTISTFPLCWSSAVHLFLHHPDSVVRHCVTSCSSGLLVQSHLPHVKSTPIWLQNIYSNNTVSSLNYIFKEWDRWFAVGYSDKEWINCRTRPIILAHEQYQYRPIFANTNSRYNVTAYFQ